MFAEQQLVSHSRTLFRRIGYVLQSIRFNLFKGSAPEVDVALEHEARIRELLLESLFVTQGVPNSVRNQLCHALHLIAKVLLYFTIFIIKSLQRDFPKSWPDLLQNLTSLLSSENTETIATVLACYDNLFKKFRIESKSTELWTELKHCLLTVC